MATHSFFQLKVSILEICGLHEVWCNQLATRYLC